MKTRVIQDEPAPTGPAARGDAPADHRRPAEGPDTTVVREADEHPPSQQHEKGSKP
jgi:hypothetical protein